MLTITKNNLSIFRRGLVGLVVSLCCVFASSSVYASIIIIIESSAEVIFPEHGQTIWRDNADPFNLTASGKGRINYSVATDAEPITLYESTWLSFDSHSLLSDDSITFAANTTTTRTWDVPVVFLTGLIGVGGHSATVKFSLTHFDKSVIEEISDTHPFSVKVIPEPSTLTIWSLLALCGIGIGWRRRRKA